MMDPLLSAVILVIAGSCGGVLAGLLGIGGGLVTVPILVPVFMAHGLSADQAMTMAVSTSLACIVLTGSSSARAHYRKGAVDKTIWLQMAPYIAVGAVIGGMAASRVNGVVLMVLFMGFALYMAQKVWRAVGKKNMPTSNATTNTSASSGLPKQPWRGVLAAGIGLFSSLVGVGGGTMTVPVLAASGVPAHRAVGTGAALGLSVAVPAVIGVLLFSWQWDNALPYSFGHINLPAFAIMSVTGMLFAPLGAKIAHKTKEQLLRRALSVLLVIVALRMASKIWGVAELYLSSQT
jgi:uncharacterized membrane protein YfcA